MKYIEATDDVQGLKHLINTSEITEVEALARNYGCVIYMKSGRSIKVDQPYKYIIEQILEKDDA